MIRVGIRELRQDASTWVRRAAAGETIEVTDRGRPVAHLGPIVARPRGLAALEATGSIRRARGRLADLPPVEPVDGARPLSEVLEELRDEDDR
jgi:prevent-host-death family protein